MSGGRYPTVQTGGPGDHCPGGVTLQPGQLAEGGVEAVLVVPVDLARLDPERPQLAGERTHIQDVLRAPHRLVAVRVDDDDQIGELMVSGKEQGLPDRPLVALAVADNCEDALPGPLAVGGEGQPDADR